MNVENTATDPFRGDWFSSENQFHLLYPPSLHTLARNHWTPLLVARKAADFLAAEKSSRILDIGSGIGKFCLAAAYYNSDCFFVGVEQREDLVQYAEAAKQATGLKNVSFIHGNITGVDFGLYDHFYFYNSFYENLTVAEKIDDRVSYSIELYNQYSRVLYKQLEQRPPGTRIATYHGMTDILPPGYLEGGNDVNGLLKFWVKV